MNYILIILIFIPGCFNTETTVIKTEFETQQLCEQTQKEWVCKPEQKACRTMAFCYQTKEIK